MITYKYLCIHSAVSSRTLPYNDCKNFRKNVVKIFACCVWGSPTCVRHKCTCNNFINCKRSTSVLPSLSSPIPSLLEYAKRICRVLIAHKEASARGDEGGDAPRKPQDNNPLTFCHSTWAETARQPTWVASNQAASEELSPLCLPFSLRHLRQLLCIVNGRFFSPTFWGCFCCCCWSSCGGSSSTVNSSSGGSSKNNGRACKLWRISKDTSTHTHTHSYPIHIRFRVYFVFGFFLVLRAKQVFPLFEFLNAIFILLICWFFR